MSRRPSAPGHSRWLARKFYSAIERGGVRQCEVCGQGRAVRGWPHPIPNLTDWCDSPGPIDPPPREAAEEFWGACPDVTTLQRIWTRGGGGGAVVIP